ncbi:MAG TPA: HAD family phosphatase [Chloroflexia bacterium]|nr:HAD family phosphatase [Chloroflexia bacterium]
MHALIFDMDGVIVDSELHWKSLEGYFLQSLIPAWTPTDQDKIIGLSTHDLYRLLTSEYGLQQSKDEFFDTYNNMAREIYTQKVSLLDGFLDLLHGVRAEELPVALASSSPRPWIEMVLDKFSLHEAFDVVVSADELHGEGKPSPAIYLLTAQKLGVEPARCVVIEDSEKGVLSARRAGMFCIGLRNGFNDEQDLSAADIVVTGFRELPYASLRRLLDKSQTV